MANWKNDYQHISVNDLHLDTKNPRTDSGERQSEDDVVRELLDENVMELAEDIVQNGYAPTSVLMAANENGKIVVIEGNRRLMALKLINSPNILEGIVDSKVFEKAKSLHNGQDFQTAVAVVYPNRTLAEKDMAKLHLDGVSIQRWKPIRQYRYFQKRIDDDQLSIDTLSELLAIGKPVIKKGVKTYQLFELAKSNLHDLEDELGDIFSDRIFKTDKFQRAIVNSEGERFLGYTFSDSNQKIEIENPQIFFTRLREVLREIFDLNPSYLPGAQFSARDRANFFKSIDPHFLSDTEYKREKKKEEEIVNGGQEVLFSPTTPPPLPMTPVVTPPPIAGSNQPPTSVDKGSRPLPDWVIDKDVRLYEGASRVKDILNELKKNAPTRGVNVNIVVVALRIVVELAVYDKLNEKGIITTILSNRKAALQAENIKRVAAGKPEKALPKDWTPGLKEMLSYLADEANSVLTDPQERKSLALLVSNYGDFVDDLDNFVHNVRYNPTDAVAKDIWKVFTRPVFEVLKKL